MSDEWDELVDWRREPGRVRFLIADPAALWDEGDEADYLGRESDHSMAPPIDLFNLRGETIALTNAFGRGLVEHVED